MDEKHNYSKSYCLATLRRLLGGRAAEKVVFSELSTGAGDDIKRATDLARKMVCEWGMSEVLGPMTFGEKNEEIFLGREIAQHRDYSEKTAQIIDQEIRQLIEEAMTDVEKMMRDHIDDLNTLAKALLEKEILDGSEIEQILQKETVPAAAGETEMTAQA
jgi:cell division protease FtsH